MTWAKFGCPAVTEPSVVVNQPNGSPWSASVGIRVCERKSTLTTNGSLRRSALRGVIASSPPPKANDARAPLTLTERTASPEKSRLKRDRSCVAPASIVTVPLTCCCGALVGYVSARS